MLGFLPCSCHLAKNSSPHTTKIAMLHVTHILIDLFISLLYATPRKPNYLNLKRYQNCHLERSKAKSKDLLFYHRKKKIPRLRSE